MEHAGDTLVHIHSSLVEARLQQARSMEEVARATENKVDAGTRQQLIQAAADMVATARAAVGITKKTYDRMENLYKEGVVTEQKRDEAKAAYDAARAQLGAAESQHSLALAGAQAEDKQAAKAMVTLLASSKGLTFADTTVRILSALNDDSRAQIDALAEELCR